MKNKEKGSSLIAVCFLIIVLSGAGLYVFKLQEQHAFFADEAETYDKERAIDEALQAFVERNGRYPCVAPLNVDYDQAGFGVEISDNCFTAPATPGTFQAAGRAGQMVRTGAVPVRTLNLPDKYIADDYNTRFVYSVTEAYAAPNAPLDGDNGAIFINDGAVAAGNNVLDRAGTAIFALISPRGDHNGTYDKNGNLRGPCTAVDSNRFSAENCNYDTDAVFRISAEKSTAPNNYFQQSIDYDVSNVCEGNADVVGEVTFVIDDSGSMQSRVGEDQCRAIGLKDSCTRMDVAHWAMRRALPTYMYNNYQKEDGPDGTYMSGFVKNINNFQDYDTDAEYAAANDRLTTSVQNTNTYTDYGDVLDGATMFEDPDAGPQTADDFDSLIDDLDDRLSRICPAGNTPLGPNMMAMAMNAGDGTEDKPNKIIVLSDGYQNDFIRFRPEDAAENISEDFPNTQVDIIDMTGINNGLASIADETNGRFFSIADPQGLLRALVESMGACVNITIEPDVDTDHCGSR